MPFVKLDCKMLYSSIWAEKAQRDVFITALLMAEPFEVLQPLPQLQVGELQPTGWNVPPGWYGMVSAASTAIIRQAMVGKEEGLQALTALGDPDPDTKSQPYEGRRLVRVDGGFIALNFITYRDRDYTGAERTRRWRERQKAKTDAAVETAAKKRANGGTIRTEHVTKSKRNGLKKPDPDAFDPRATMSPRAPEL